MRSKIFLAPALCLTILLHADEDPCCPCTPERWGFYVQAAPLIWHAHINGASVAIETSGSENLFNQAGKSRVKNIDFNWDWGFRVGLGANICHDAWDTLIQWTYWRTDGSKKLHAPTGGALYPTRGTPALIQNETAQAVDSKWKMRYDILDWENGKCFYVSNCLSLRPFAGLRTAWIKQNFDTLYEGLAIAGTTPIPANSHLVDQQDRFWGIGIRGGLDLRWNLFCDLSLFSHTAASLLYAYHNVTQKEESLLDVQNFFHVGSAIFDMQIGLGWDQCFCSDQYHIGFDLGWELHWHPDQTQFFTFVDDVMLAKFVLNQGDLGIQGFFLKLRFDF